MNILVTGGAGYIGSHVVKEILEKRSDDVVILDNFSTGSRRNTDTLKKIDVNGRLKIIEADLSNFSLVEGIFKSYPFDAIIHFAASIIVPESVENPLKYYMNNTVNTTNLIRLANNYGVKRFIFSSTAAVYGEPEEVPVKETTTLSPINPYGMSKLMSERVLIDTAKANNDFKYVILRYFNVAGADMNNAKTIEDINPRIGQAFPEATHLIKVAAETATGKRDKIYIFGDDYDTKDGTCIRDYIHVDDLAMAHLQALDYLNENESDIFNCGYGHGYTVKEVINTMKKVSGVDFKVEITGRRAGDPSKLIADNSKILNKLGWQPKFDNLELICKSAFEWEKRLDLA